MSEPERSHDHVRPPLPALLLAVAVLAFAMLACSIGSAFTTRSGVGGEPTKTRRATFTPLPIALGTPVADDPVVRGTLPPGVTAGVAVGNTPGAENGAPRTGTLPLTTAGPDGLLIYATDTPTPSPTATAPRVTWTPTEEPGDRTPEPTPFVVVKPATLNGRRGPGTNYERVGQGKAGQTLFILGRSEDGLWYQVCCLANQPVWVAAEQVETRGAATSVAVLPAPPTALPAPPTTRPLPPAPSVGQSPLATPGPVGTPQPPFDVARGPEFPIRRDNGLLTIWVKVYEGPSDNERPLGGYILKVTRDGVDVSDNLQSHSGRGFDNTTARQGGYDYNLKFEMYNAGEADWEIYLARPGGFRVSPVTKFTTKGDSYRNLVVFIAYLLAR